MEEPIKPIPKVRVAKPIRVAKVAEPKLRAVAWTEDSPRLSSGPPAANRDRRVIIAGAVVGFVVLLFLFVLSQVGSSVANQSNRKQEVASPPHSTPTTSQVPHPCKYIDSKTEDRGRLVHLMELYAFSGEINERPLVAFLKQKKLASNRVEGIYFIVIFDDEQFARFPKDPFTAEYGLEYDVKHHIRAIYAYNNVNGYSRVRYHQKNIWEHKTIEKDI